jgi:phospholipid/cholesterol/gamma-HCH transport system substrate-binding protein
MRSVSVAGRLAAIAAVVAAIVIVAILLFSGGSSYSVHAVFENAAQLVKGDPVEIGGTNVGSVDDISLTPNGLAEVKMSIDKKYTPLRQGTTATIRQASLSGIANRYIDLTMPPGQLTKGNQISNGGMIDITRTTTEVDLDQLFNAIDPKTRTSLKDFFRNSAAEFKGKEPQQQLAYHYLNPALSTSSRLFNELDRDKPLLEHFLVDSASFVTDVAQKRDALAALIGNLNTTFRAIGSQKAALAESLSRLPGFMRQANTTFVDLRSALDDVDPLVNASKPVAPRLDALLHQLRPFAADARPTVHDLSKIVFQPGANNDLFDLEQSLPPLASIALDTKNRSYNAGGGPKSVGNVQGAFPQTIKALNGSTPIIAFGRPYTPELVGWFDDFSTSGMYDAAGNFTRVFTVFNAVDAASQVPTVIPLNQQGSLFGQLSNVGQYHRCPGGGDVVAPDKSNLLSAQEQQALGCKESDRAVQNVK